MHSHLLCHRWLRMDAAHVQKRSGVFQKVFSRHALRLLRIQGLIHGSTQELVSDVLLAASEVHVPIGGPTT